MKNYISIIFDYDFFILDDIHQKRVFEDKCPKSNSMNNNASTTHMSHYALCPKSSKMICTVNDKHSDFLKMLPILIDRYGLLESSLNAFYCYALEDVYQIEYASEKIRIVDNLLKEMHPYFDDSGRRINYIIDNLLQYCRYMTDKRFTDFLYQNIPEYQAIADPSDVSCNQKSALEGDRDIQKQEKHLLTCIEKQKEFFCEKEKRLSYRLFAPIYGLMENRFPENKLTDICQCLYAEYIAPKQPEDLQSYIRKYKYLHIQEYSNSRKIMPKLYELSDAIGDYFSNACEIASAYQGVSTTQVYALFLTHYYFLIKQIENLTVCLSPYYMFEQCRNLMEEKRRNENQPILLYPDENYFEHAADDIYNRFKDNLDKQDADKNILVKELNSIYPKDLQLYINSTRIDFQDFEQVIVLEFLDILKKNYTIKKCPTCGTYFITQSKKIQYCGNHRASHTSHQNNYKERQKESFPYYDIYMRYYNCFKQRINRQKISDKRTIQTDNFNRWNDEVRKMNSHYSELNITDADAYISKLDGLSEKYHFSPSRSYSKSK